MNDLDIFINAPEDLTPEELSAYLDHACEGDAGLRKRVEDLFAANGRPEDFMEHTAFPQEGSDVTKHLESPGSIIGDYKLLQEIGIGGFGTVYMADQLAPIKRRVALKIIKLGMDTKQVVARFEVERQALAMMDHPNIAKVHDAGATETGRPYFVMELVRGLPITKFCQEQNLNTESRLALFVDVCNAIQHAHQKGIIHRDLKPSNVIVTLHDDKAVPKVIDFGVAKATQQDLTEKTLFTQFEQFIGTPAYMSPEQAQMSGLDIDTRSDIYALGVLLYELLTGTTPFDGNTLAKSGQDEIRRVIREEDPPKPSTRLTEIQARGLSHSEIRMPDSEIDQELDWIVMKALEKDRTRRYDTATSLAGDIQRHLANEPVEAGPPSAAYRIGKYFRRNRGLIVTATAFGFVLMLATLISSWMAVSATQANRVAEEARQTSERDRLAAEVRLADKHLISGNEAMGLAMLTRVLREHPDHHVAGERLMSALRLRDFAREPLTELPPIVVPGLSADGSKVIATAASPEKAFRVYEFQTGKPLGEPMPHEDYLALRGIFRPNHPDQVVTVTVNRNPLALQAQLWNWQTGERLGPEMDLGYMMFIGRFSPDGERLLFGGNGYAQVFDPNTSKPVGKQFSAWGITVEGEFSPVLDANGDRWAAFAEIAPAQVMVWNVSASERGEEVEFPLPVLGNFKRLAFDHAGERIAAGADDGTIVVWNFRTGKLLTIAEDSSIVSVAFSPDDQLLLTATLGGKARIWVAKSGQLVSTVNHDDALSLALFSPDGRHFLTSCFDERVRVWNTDSSQQVSVEIPSGGEPQFSPDGNHLVTAHGFRRAGGQGTEIPTRIWEIRPSAPRNQRFRHRPTAEDSSLGLVGPIYSIDWSSDGQRLLTSGNDKRVRLWNVSTGLPIDDGFVYPRVRSAHLSPDGSVVSAVGHHGVRIWDAESGKNMPPFGSEAPFSGGVFSHQKDDHGRFLVATGSYEGAAQVWDAATGEALSPPLRHDAFVFCVAFSPDDRFLVSGSVDRTARVWDLSNGHLLHVFNHEDRVDRVSFSSTGKRILTVSVDGSAGLWDAESGDPVCERLRHPDNITDATFSPDGRLVLTCSQDGTARLWNAISGEPIHRTIQHERAIVQAVFSPDGKRVATASHDGTARVWDVESGLPLSEPLPHDGHVHLIRFSPDGQRLVTGGNDATARLWEMPPYPDTDIPTWVLDWADAVAGLRLLADDRIESLAPPERRRLHAEVNSRRGDDYFHKVAAWFYQKPDTRTIDPFSIMTRDQWVSNRIRENTVTSLEEALLVDPDNLEALKAFAIALTPSVLSSKAPKNVLRAESYARRALARLTESDTWQTIQDRVSLLKVLGEHERIVSIVDKALESTSNAHGPEDRRQYKALLRIKTEAFETLGRTDQAAAIRRKITAIPPRDPDMDPNMLDLTSFYTESLTKAEKPTKDSHAFWTERLAETYQPHNGPGFDIRGAIQLNSGVFDSGGMKGKDHNRHTNSHSPMQVTGILVGQSAQKMHFLLRCLYGGASNGEDVATVTVHYTDGTKHPIPLIYGRDMIDHFIQNRTEEGLAGVEHLEWNQPFTVPWSGSPGTLALTRKVWQNPHPNKEIATIDFTSGGKQAAPQLMAVTLE